MEEAVCGDLTGKVRDYHYYYYLGIISLYHQRPGPMVRMLLQQNNRTSRDDGGTPETNPVATRMVVIGALATLSAILLLTDFQKLTSLRVGVHDGYSTKKFRREQLRSTTAIPSHSDGLLAESKDQATLSDNSIGKSESVKQKDRRKQIPCQLLGNFDFTAPDGNVTDDASRFHATPLDSWTCHQEDTDDYFLATLEFQIHECPPKYSASAFQLRASTSQSRVMGHVGERYRVRDECGIYNASVSVMDYDYGRNGAVTVELFWTSDFRHYSNHKKDIIDAHSIKQDVLPEEEIKALFTDERLAYLQRHLDRLPNFPIQLQMQVSRTTFNNNPLLLPDCGTVPLDDWSPVGVFDGPVNDTSHLAPPEEAPRWPFRSAKCQFHSRTLSQYNELLAGLRIKYLGDSHMGEINFESMGVMCPEMEDAAYFDRQYDCEFRNNTFNFAYRFFRMRNTNG